MSDPVYKTLGDEILISIHSAAIPRQAFKHLPIDLFAFSDAKAPYVRVEEVLDYHREQLEKDTSLEMKGKREKGIEDLERALIHLRGVLKNRSARKLHRN